jgi:deoxyribodipyrimidine photolyase-like uncharacterized protein
MFQTAFQPNAFQNNAFQINITPPTPTGPTGGDGWTKEEYKRYRALAKKKRLAEEKRIEALKVDAENRKQIITDLVDPQPKVTKRNKNKVELKQEVSIDVASNLANIDRYIANLEKQQQDLQNAVAMKQAKLRLEQELAVLEAKRQAELDDEEALLALIT